MNTDPLMRAIAEQTKALEPKQPPAWRRTGFWVLAAGIFVAIIGTVFWADGLEYASPGRKARVITHIIEYGAVGGALILTLYARRR